MIYGFTNTVWENLDILLILNCLDPGQFLGANMAYRFILLMLYDFEVILFKSGSMFNIRISEEKILKILLYRIYSSTSSRYFVYDSINLSSLWLLVLMWPMGLLLMLNDERRKVITHHILVCVIVKFHL